MEQQVKNATLFTALEMFKFNNHLVNNLVNNIHEEDASKRLGESTHFAWNLGHVIETRAELCTMLGSPISYSYSEFFKNQRPMDVETTYPTIHLLMEDWPMIAESSIQALSECTEEQLSSSASFEVPMGNGDLLSVITFLAHHETYHIGEMGVMRRALGYPPLQFT